MREEMVVQIRRGLALLRQIIQPRDDTDGDGFLIRVHESAASHALGAVPDNGVSRSFTIGEVKAFLHFVLSEMNHGLYAHRKIL